MLPFQTKATHWLCLFFPDNLFHLAVLPHLNISYCTGCHLQNCAGVQLECSSGHLQMTRLICLRLTLILYQHCCLFRSPAPLFSLAWCLSPHNLCLLYFFILSVSSSDCCHISNAPPPPLSLSLSFPVCLLPCAVPQGSLADVIYAIYFASVRGERPEASTLHAECSCGRRWASTDWA